MNAFTRSISKVFKRAMNAFQTFPVTITCALAFSIVTMIRIQLDWPQQEEFNFLFNCLHWSFAMGAIFGLAAITAAQSRFDKAKAFVTANILGVVAVAITFLGLYFGGAADLDSKAVRVTMLSDLAMARVGAMILVSFLVFVVLAGYPKDKSDFARSLFMTQKAFFIALIYGLVIMAGVSGVAGAIEALLYNDMSSKVYMYISTLTGFLAFTIFVGYFPDFRKGMVDDHRQIAQKQPRFVEVLFGYIMIPIVMALTVVLLIWAGRTLVTGEWPMFVQLYSIATAYALSGIWLHVMVTHHELGTAKFYRKIYPIAALVILAFEARALLIQLSKSSLKTTEYYFILIWIVAVVASILLLKLKAKAHLVIVILICALAIFSVSPVVSYQDLPVRAQVGRLENLLVSYDMLEGNQLVPAAVVPELEARESITDAVNYLARAKGAKLPEWFDEGLREKNVFEAKFGFEQVWPKDDFQDRPGDYMGISLRLLPEAIDISDYGWAVKLKAEYGSKDEAVQIEGSRGVYQVYWKDSPNEIPSLKITLGNRVILEEDMNEYIDQITETFPLGEGKISEATFEDMSYKLEIEEIKVLLVFSNIEINVDPREDVIRYWFNLDILYFDEKL